MIVIANRSLVYIGGSGSMKYEGGFIIKELIWLGGFAGVWC